MSSNVNDLRSSLTKMLARRGTCQYAGRDGEGPSWFRDGLEMAQDGPKEAQDGARMAQDGPKMAQDGPKRAPIKV